MNIEKELVTKELADLRRRKIRQLTDSVVDRDNASKVLPDLLCDEGGASFLIFCEDTSDDRFSMHCYPKKGDCGHCREVFFSYVVELPDRSFLAPTSIG